MKAWTQDRYGDERVLELRDVPSPVPGDDDVLVRVQAVGLNAADVHLMTGTPYMVRAIKGLRRPRVPVLGTDFAGVVEQVGDAVTTVAVGDVVMGQVDRGSLAELVAAPSSNVAQVPDSCSPLDAAALPMTGFTALQTLRDVAKVQPGERVLVNGASSGVGVATVQIAVAMGATVVGVCSGRNAELVRSLGAVDVVDYTTTDFTDTPDRYDVIVDIVSSQPLSRMRRILTPNGRIAMVGATHKGRLLGMGRQMRGAATSAYARQKALMVMAKVTRADLEEVARLMEQGSLRPVVDAVYDFADTPVAMGQLRGGHVAGKVLVRGHQVG